MWSLAIWHRIAWCQADGVVWGLMGMIGCAGPLLQLTTGRSRAIQFWTIGTPCQQKTLVLQHVLPKGLLQAGKHAGQKSVTSVLRRRCGWTRPNTAEHDCFGRQKCALGHGVVAMTAWNSSGLADLGLPHIRCIR
jgi:hypothetical protein